MAILESTCKRFVICILSCTLTCFVLFAVADGPAAKDGKEEANGAAEKEKKDPSPEPRETKPAPPNAWSTGVRYYWLCPSIPPLRCPRLSVQSILPYLLIFLQNLCRLGRQKVGGRLLIGILLWLPKVYRVTRGVRYTHRSSCHCAQIGTLGRSYRKFVRLHTSSLDLGKGKRGGLTVPSLRTKRERIN